MEDDSSSKGNAPKTPIQKSMRHRPSNQLSEFSFTPSFLSDRSDPLSPPDSIFSHPSTVGTVASEIGNPFDETPIRKLSTRQQDVLSPESSVCDSPASRSWLDTDTVITPFYRKLQTVSATQWHSDVPGLIPLRELTSEVKDDSEWETDSQEEIGDVIPSKETIDAQESGWETCSEEENVLDAEGRGGTRSLPSKNSSRSRPRRRAIIHCKNARSKHKPLGESMSIGNTGIPRVDQDASKNATVSDPKWDAHRLLGFQHYLDREKASDLDPKAGAIIKDTKAEGGALSFVGSPAQSSPPTEPGLEEVREMFGFSRRLSLPQTNPGELSCSKTDSVSDESSSRHVPILQVSSSGESPNDTAGKSAASVISQCRGEISSTGLDLPSAEYGDRHPQTRVGPAEADLSVEFQELHLSPKADFYPADKIQAGFELPETGRRRTRRTKSVSDLRAVNNVSVPAHNDPDIPGIKGPDDTALERSLAIVLPFTLRQYLADDLSSCTAVDIRDLDDGFSSRRCTTPHQIHAGNAGNNLQMLENCSLRSVGDSIRRLVSLTTCNAHYQKAEKELLFWEPILSCLGEKTSTTNSRRFHWLLKWIRALRDTSIHAPLEWGPDEGTKNTVRNWDAWMPKRQRKSSVREVLRELIQSPLTDEDEVRQGTIYMFINPPEHGYLKIGYSNDVEKRMNYWEKQCGKPVSSCFPRTREDSKPVKHIYRLEQLIHAELKEHRHRILHCTGCGIQHKEWFKVKQTVAMEVTRKWIRWMRERPYEPYLEEDGTIHWILKQTEERRLDELCRPHRDVLPSGSRKTNKPLVPSSSRVPRSPRLRQRGIAVT